MASKELPDPIELFLSTLNCGSEDELLVLDLCKDPEIRAALAKYSSDDDPEKCVRVIEFLNILPSALNLCVSDTPIYRVSTSVARKELRQLSTQARKFSKKIKFLNHLLSIAADKNYLIRRLEAESKGVPFVLNRMGLRAASCRLRQDQHSLTDLLEAFAEDIDEELNYFPGRLEALDGSENAQTKRLIRLLIIFSQRTMGGGTDAMIAAIASHLAVRAGFTNAEKGIDEERVKKARQKYAKEMLIKDSGKN